MLTVDTPGATIHYTRDGQNPTESDPSLVSGGSVVVTETQTLKAKAWAPGMASGETAIAAYTMKVATPSYSPAGGTYTSARTVTITSATSGAAIRYTTDGSTPSATSPVYTGPVTIDTTTTLKAVGLKASWSDSVAQSSTYTMNFGSLAAPAMSPTAGTYERQVSVTLTGSPGATIRYTTNGSTPTGTSPVFAAPLLIEATATVKAKAFHPDYATSGETAQAYTISVPAPVLSLASGPYDPGTHVTITSPDPAATLRISLDGSDPTATDPTLASGATLLVGTFTLKVRAFKAGCSDSAVAAATYLLTGPLGAGAVAAGGSHTALATPDGLLYAWGQNSSGQVGDSTTTGRSTPVLVQTLTGVTALAAGQNHTLAVTHDGRVFGWGANGSGQVGDDSTTNRSRPVEIAGLTNVVSVAAGNNHSLALTGDGVVYAWGSGSSGQLGLGTTATEHLPALVPGLTNVTAIAAGGSHSLAVTSTGQVYAWGANGSSQIGDDATTNRTSPTLVPGVSGVVAVAAGSLHSMARRSDGAVYVWGAGGSGQLGLGTTTVQRTPTLIPSFAPSKVVAGGTHSVGVGGYTPLVAWGANSSGQIGDTTTTLRTTPTVVAGPQSVALAAAGGSHTVAITPTGEVWTWGNGSSGQLGDGGSALRAVPIPISDPGFVWRTARPYFNVPAGTYNAPFNVVVNVVTAGAVIHYTTNGVDPTETDPVVAQGGVVSISETTTIKARAWIGGQAPSATATATYRIQVTPVAAAPVAGIYTTAQIVTLTSTTSGASIHYTTDGSTPSEASPAYVGPIAVSTSLTIKAVALRLGWEPSSIATLGYQMSFGTLADPVITPAAGVHPYGQTVTMSAPGAGSIRYTTDGTTPGVASLLYTEPLGTGWIVDDQSSRLPPRLDRERNIDRLVLSAQAASPAFSPGGGSYSPGQLITISSVTPGTVIRYTTTGVEPTLNDPVLVNGGTIVAGNFDLKARAFGDGLIASRRGCHRPASRPSTARAAVVVRPTRSVSQQQRTRAVVSRLTALSRLARSSNCLLPTA